jgi:prolyl oligopeptidase
MVMAISNAVPVTGEMMRFTCLVCVLPLLLARPASAAGADPYLWLEQVNSPRALAWVKAEDDRSLKILEADPHYAPFYAEALTLAQAPDRIPVPDFTGGEVTNLWQDQAHVQGIWRATSLAGYASAAVPWRTVLDLDALSRAEHHHWVWEGADCYPPDDKTCLISLSDGGEDAVTTREFAFPSGVLVPGGFDIARAKQSLDWETPDSLIVGTDWGPGSMTDSGYPFIIKRLRRGQALSAAVEIFRGTPADVSVEVQGYTDGQGHRVVILQRGLEFFRSQFFQVTSAGVEKLALPEKSELEGFLDDRLIVKIDEPVGHFMAGSLLALDLGHANAAPVLVFAPNKRQAVDEVDITKTHIVAAILDNVRGRALVLTPAGDGYQSRVLDLPDNAAIHLISASERNDEIFLEVTSFLRPTALYLADAGSAAPPAVIKSLPAQFDASGDTVDQLEATSSDGTEIPYFIVRPKGMKLDGQNPTLLYAYGGFQISETPTYSPGLGKLWLERGGVFVLANIRGGGEFGPAWHEAGLKTKRQIVFNDFAAVAEDLIRRRITSPAHLGIRGGSNGGLLMGVEFEQHPDLWHAVVIEVPLLDMLRYEKIEAGASWVGEYGSVSNPAERAFLARISPYQNLRAGVHYPTPFIFTTTKDDRVGPEHARKFAAKMQAMHLPFLYYESTEGGHAAGANQQEKAQEQALEMTYLTSRLMPGG